jgi:hypothetical protein
LNLIKNKQAQHQNYFAVIIFLFFFGIFNIIGYTLWIEFVSALTTAGFNTGSVALTIADWTNGFRAFDYIIVILMVIFIIGTGITAYRIMTSTAFFIVTIIMGIFWGFVSYFFNYIFIQIVTQPIFNATLGYFGLTMRVCTNLHWIMLVEIIVGSLFLYGKKEKELETLT